MNKFLRLSVPVLVLALVFSLGVSASSTHAVAIGPSFGSEAHANTTSTTLTISKPSSTATGDVLIGTVGVNGGSDVTITAPTGWTLIRRTNNGTNDAAASYYRVVTGSDTASTTYAWTINYGGHGSRAGGAILRYTGVNTSTPVDVSSGATGSSNSPTGSAVTTTTANDLIIAFFSVDSSGSMTAPASMTERFDQTQSSGPNTAAYDVAQASVGTTGTKQASATANSDWEAQIIALKPAALSNQATLTVTGLPSSATYAQTGITAGTSGGSGTGAVTYSAGASTACSVGSSTGVVTITSGTGTCTITATKAADSSYNAATSAGVSITIGKATSTTTVSCPESVTYNATAQTPCTVSVTGANLSLTPTASYSDNTNAGTATAAYTYAGDTNHSGSTDSKNFTIAQRAITVTADASQNKVYGASDPTLTAHVTSETTLAGEDSLSGSLSRDEGEDVGNYNITVGSLTAGSNYNLSFVTDTFQITPADAPISITNLNQDYNGTPRSATVSTSEGASYSVTYTGTDGTEYATSATAPTNAGTYTVSVTITDDNHSGSASDTLTIHKINATITVTPYTVTYDGSEHRATGTATGIGESDLSEGLNLSNTAHTNAGNYSEDSWSFSGGTNYNSTKGETITDVINKANATINVSGYEVTYDGESHTATGSATGVGGEEDLLRGLDLSGTTHTEVGVYHDSWSFTGGTNYNNAGGEESTVTDVINSPGEKGTYYTLSYTAGAHGTISGDAIQKVAAGANGANVNAAADEGYYFDHWSDGSRSNPRMDQYVSGDVTVSAVFLQTNSQRGGGRNSTGGDQSSGSGSGQGSSNNSGSQGGQVLGASTYNFSKNLWYRMPRNSEVSELQKFLVGKGYSIPSSVTTWFGTETLAAVKAFQKDHGLEVTGFVGPLTRAEISKG